MLQTWRLNSKKEKETHQRQVFDPETARPIVQQACNGCRMKKLRCTGEKTGCSRCHSLSQYCVYAQSGARRKSKTKTKTKRSASRTDDDGQYSQSPGNNSSSPSALTYETAASPFSPPPGPSASGSTTPNAERYVTSDHPESKATQPALFELNMAPFEPQNYWSIQNVSTVQMTGQFSDPWQQLWSESAQEDGIAAPKVSWNGHVTNPQAMPSSFARWDSGVEGYDEMSLSPTSKQSTFFSDVHETPLPPRRQRGPEDRQWLSSQIQEPCQCFQRVNFIVKDLEHGSVGTRGMELGPWLSRHKEALRCGEALLSCPLYPTEPQHMDFLAFLTDRLIAICDDVVSAYMEILNHDTTGSKDGAWHVWVGGFKIDSSHEWSALVRTLLAIQLGSLDTLMVRFKGLRRSVDREGVQQRADLTQRRVIELLQKLQSI